STLAPASNPSTMVAVASSLVIRFPSVELPFSPLSKNLPAPTINTSAGFATDVKEHKKMDAGRTVCVVRVSASPLRWWEVLLPHSEFPPFGAKRTGHSLHGTLTIKGRARPPRLSQMAV